MLSFGWYTLYCLGDVPVYRTQADTPSTSGTGDNIKVHRIELILMTYFLPYSLPFLLSRILHRHLGIYREGAAIPAPEPHPLLFDHLVIDIKAVTGGTEKGADTAAYTLGSYLFPEFLIKR